MVLIVCCGLVAGCGGPVAPDPVVPRVPVILISLDTLRADHLSCYGYARETTPHLDRWAREEAILFENAVTPETWTLPAHISMFTGLYPQHHAVTRDQPLAEDVPTLPELLQAAGYQTAGFTGHTWWMQPERGFGRGMDHYDNAPEMLRHIDETRARLYGWLEQRTEAPPFIFFHAYDLHYKIREMGYQFPYEPGNNWPLDFAQPYLAQGVFSEGEKAELKASELILAWREGRITFSEAEHAAIVALYDDTLRMVDAAIAEVFERLRQEGLYEDALIIVTSDHGEGLGERGYYDHEDVWEEEARVPLLMKLPGAAHAGARVQAQVQLIDILPTVTEVLGLGTPAPMDGISLLRTLEDGGHTHAYVRNGGGRLGVRTQRWKLHWQTQGENTYRLFNLEEDPGELTDRLMDATVPAKDLRERAHRFFGLAQPGWHIEVLAPRDSTWRGALRARVTPQSEYAFRFDSWGNALAVSSTEPGAFSLELGASAPEQLVIPVIEAGELTFSLEASEPFALFFEGVQKEGLTQSDHVLDSTSQSYPRPASLPETTGPRVSLWFIPAPPGMDAASLPPDLEEQLRALGYLKD